MGYNLLINGVYWSYNPLTNHLLASWDIQVVELVLPATSLKPTFRGPSWCTNLRAPAKAANDNRARKWIAGSECRTLTAIAVVSTFERKVILWGAMFNSHQFVVETLTGESLCRKNYRTYLPSPKLMWLEIVHLVGNLQRCAHRNL